MENAKFLSFDTDTKVLFFAQQRDDHNVVIREHAIFEQQGEITYAFADETDNIVEESAISEHQAFACMIRHLNVPL